MNNEGDKSEAESPKDRLESIRKLRNELLQFKILFEAAFEELHGVIVAKISKPGIYIAPHSDYPRRSITDSGFPIFHSIGFYSDSAPRDYASTIKPSGLLGFLSGSFDVESDALPALDKFIKYLQSHQFGSRLKYTDYKGETSLAKYTINGILGGAVEKYLHRHGIEAEVDQRARDMILGPLLSGVIQRTHELSLMVPIALTHFEIERLRLSETTYIARIPERLQLSRARMRNSGTGASEQVAHAATHAFISNGWSLEVEKIDDVSKSLSSASQEALDAVDSFLGALRVATGVKTGYAQLVWVPRKWALDYYCDLPPVYGTTVRQYPSEFDNYGWVRECPTVTNDEMTDVRTVFEQMNSNQSEAVRLAVRRLNSCLTRNDPSDAVLDGTIGLELLLGDDQNQSLSYKLRLRAAALTWLSGSSMPATEIADKVKQVYAIRSAIVHGKKPKACKKAVDSNSTQGEDDRQLAAELLRFVLRVLLAHPRYLDPSIIDSELILRGASVASEGEPGAAL
ncbi:hypothetical protein LX81_03831 [Palleronia aestuarii]|uniref:Uncharacterized protein n=1 Tax=Palleronia aestuarii TaxID=568105 RepID=A0A2W7MUE7_9RHOB|nr:HEPN domain-containing protein [Palleronia aestuarii]PZX11755.1 hypothetical protein LX81_03831 [Palleronia aestuarii]